MKKRIFLISLLMFAFLTPVSGAHAQGYPTFDVAKLASLITNLIGRFQPVPQVLSRINQVKETIKQIEAVSKDAVVGKLKSFASSASSAFQEGAFSNGLPKSVIAEAAASADGAKQAAQKVMDTMFVLNDNVQQDISTTMAQIQQAEQARKEYVDRMSKEALAKLLYMTSTASEMAQERMQKANEAVKNAQSIQDGINANTMMIMVGNFERLNQILVSLVSLKRQVVAGICSTPVTGYKKPDPYKLSLGGAEYVEDVKGGPDVDL